MNDVIEFLEAFFTAECDANDASRQLDNDDFNSKLARMNEFLIDSLHNSFGIVPRKNDEVYDGIIGTRRTPKRHLFRIDRWEHEQYPELFGAYVSPVGALGLRKYGHLLFVARVEGQLKIVRRYFLDVVGDGKNRWQMSGGDESIELTKLKKPLEILRLLAPDQDARGDSMERYLKD